MGHSNDGSLVPFQVLFEPCDGFGVQMVRRFVEEQYIGFFEEQSAQSDPPFLSAGKYIHRSIARRTAERIHGHVQPGIEVPSIHGIEFFLNPSLFGEEFFHFVVGQRIRKPLVDLVVFFQEVHNFLHSFRHDFFHRFLRAEKRFLLEISNRISRRENGLTTEILIDSCEYFQQRALSGTVQTDDSDLGAVKIGKRNIFEHSLLIIVPAHAHHGIDDLIRFIRHITQILLVIVRLGSILPY